MPKRKYSELQTGREPQRIEFFEIIRREGYNQDINEYIRSSGAENNFDINFISEPTQSNINDLNNFSYNVNQRAVQPQYLLKLLFSEIMSKRKYSELQTEEELQTREFFELMRREAYDPDIDIEYIRSWVAENNFDINFISDPTLPNRTVLNAFSLNGDQRAVQILLELGADVEGVTADAPENEPTALYAAVARGYTTIVSLFLDHGANVNAVNQYQQTLLHQAAEEGYANIVSMLLSVPGINIQAVDSNGRTAMDIAMEENQHSIVDLFLNHAREDAIAPVEVTSVNSTDNVEGVSASDDEIVSIMFAGANFLSEGSNSI